MDFEEIAILINQVAVERKGRPLKDVERLVLKGAWENKTYSAMATPTAGYTEDYLKKDVGPKLWLLLSDLVDSDGKGIRVTKRNIQNVLQTWATQDLLLPAIAPSPFSGRRETSRLPRDVPALAVRDAPRIDLTNCYGREADLAQITRWILEEDCRTVLLWGLPGVGKTTLAAVVAAAIAPQVDQCGYLALASGANDCDLDRDLVGAIAHWLDPDLDPETDLADSAPLAVVDWLLDQLTQRRVVLILDDMDQLFEAQQPAGSYRPHTEALQHLFRQGADRHHHSCLVWLSREKPLGLAQGQGPRVQDYSLGDLTPEAARSLLSAPPATGPDDWSALIDRYGGHPLVLRGLGATLHEVYQGRPRPLLQAPQLTVPVVVHSTFSQALERLLPAEWELLYWLAIAQQATTLDDLKLAMQPPLPEAVVQSVLGRGWASGTSDDGGGLQLSLAPVVQTLVLERLQALLLGELKAERLDWLHRLPLIAMAAREAVQERQRAALLVPLGDALKRHYATADALVAKGDRLIKAIQPLRGQPGYGASNIIHLCQYLGLSVSGADFSHRTIWQGDLRRVSLQGANFTQAEFSDTAFATALGRNPVAAFSPSTRAGDRYLATGDPEGRLLLWDLNRGKLVWMFDEGQSQGVQSLAFSPQGDLLAVGTETGQIWLWPVGETYQTDILDHHQAPVNALAFSPDGSQLASGDESGRLCLWEVASGFKQGHLDGHQGPIHTLAYDATGAHLISGGDQQACLWRIGDRTLIKTLQARSTAAIRTAGFLCDPNDAACPPIPYAAGYDDHCLTIWNLETSLPCWILPANVDALLAMAVSPNGRYLVCSRQDFTVALWDIPDRRACYTLTDLGVPVWALAFSADSRYFVTGSDYTIQLWSAKRGQRWRSFLSQAHRLQSLAFRADPTSGTILTGHDDAHLRLWSITKGNPYASGPRTLTGHDGPLRTLALSADGQWLASTDDQTLRLWSSTGQCQWVMATPGPTTLLSFSPDGQWLVAAGASGISLWATATGSSLGDLDQTPASPSALAISPNGQWIVVGVRDGTIGLWPRSPGNRPSPLLGHQSQVHSLALGLDGSILASASHDGTLCWWPVETGDRPSPAPAPSPLGQWQHPTEQWLQAVTLDPGGDILAITSQDNQLEVWDVVANRQRHILRGHSQGIWQVAVSPSRTHLVTASQDDEIRVWALDTGLCQQTLRPDRPYEGVNICRASGLSSTEERMLKSLGAIVSY